MKLALVLFAVVASCTGGSTGGGGDCKQQECFRAYQCRTSCTAPVQSSGCCPCPAGTFDDVGVCLPDGGMRDAG